MSELWLPGVSGPQDAFVSRVLQRVQAFAEQYGSQPRVDVDLRDGATVTVRAISPEPGFGFVTLTPHADAEDAVEEWIVPVGAFGRITLSLAEEHEPFGFSLPE
ncbi:MAG TPA: hypothetical protein VLU96_03865 [Gaiellaceae bacterium]|nr:hypothetical protein [Gaiellaceae bacterium]